MTEPPLPVPELALRRDSTRTTNSLTGSETVEDKKLSSESIASRLALATVPPERPTLLGYLRGLVRKKKAVLGRGPDDIATQHSVFDDASTLKVYAPPAEWENSKNFDPDFRWTWKEEKEVINIVDRRVLLFACLFFAGLNLDRDNLSAANSDGILKDLKLTTDDYNLATTLFRAMFLIAELPGQVISKRIGPDRFIPLQMSVWALVTLFQMFVSGRTSFILCRCLLGLAQGSFIPDLLLYLSYFYKTSETPLRLAFFWVAMNATSFFSSFLSYGILHMRGVAGLAGWRWLFMWEGILTLSLGILAFFVMVPSPSQTKTRWNKAWFTERQAKISVMRVLRDDHGKSTMHNRQALDFKMFWKVLTDWRLLPLYIIGLVFGIPPAPVKQYLTIVLRQLGFSTFDTNLLNSVQFVAAIFTGIAIVVVSEALDERALVAAWEDIWVLPFLIAIFCLPKKPNPWTYYGLATALLSNPYSHPLQAAWVSANAGDVETRTIAASIYNMMVQAGSIISANIYRKSDAPQYRTGNAVLIGVCAFNIAFYVFTKFFYVKLNAHRQRKWDALTKQQQVEYLETTKDTGNRRLNFRFIH